MEISSAGVFSWEAIDYYLDRLFGILGEGKIV
jgi:hypothetical protein